MVDREEIIEALGGSDPEWVSAAFAAVSQVAVRQPTLTTDDLWRLIAFPAGAAGGRAMGKVVRWALASGLVAKATSGRFLLCYDHAALDPVRTLDGTLIRHQGPLVVYESLVYNAIALLDPLTPSMPRLTVDLDGSAGHGEARRLAL